jgi:hypothetical protein
MVIAPGGRPPVNIDYILDESLLQERLFDFSRTEFVPIGWAKISRRSLCKRLFGTPEADEPAAPPLNQMTFAIVEDGTWRSSRTRPSLKPVNPSPSKVIR